MQVIFSFLAAAALLAAAGCSKSGDARVESVATDTGARVSPSATPEAQGAKPSAEITEAQLAELTQVVRRYGMEQKKAPQNFDEIIAKGYLPKLPDAPAGKRFAINSKLEVYLAED